MKEPRPMNDDLEGYISSLQPYRASVARDGARIIRLTLTKRMRGLFKEVEEYCLVDRDDINYTDLLNSYGDASPLRDGFTISAAETVDDVPSWFADSYLWGEEMDEPASSVAYTLKAQKRIGMKTTDIVALPDGSEWELYGFKEDGSVWLLNNATDEECVVSESEISRVGPFRYQEDEEA